MKGIRASQQSRHKFSRFIRSGTGMAGDHIARHPVLNIKRPLSLMFIALYEKRQ